MAVLKPSQLQLISNMSGKLMREPRDDLADRSNSDLDVNSANEVVEERHVELAYKSKEPID